MAREVIVRLGERDVTITQLRTRQNAEWRKKLEVPFQEVAKGLQTLTSSSDIDLSDGESLSNLVRSIAMPLIHSMDTCLSLVLDYAPNASEAVDEAYDDEVITALVEILKLAYPFGAILKLVQGLTGSQTRQTSQN